MINKEKKIKQLDIVFENCEVCTLKPDMIYACIIDKIYSGMSINCFQYHVDESSLDTCMKIYFVPENSLSELSEMMIYRVGKDIRNFES